MEPIRPLSLPIWPTFTVLPVAGPVGDATTDEPDPPPVGELEPAELPSDVSAAGTVVKAEDVPPPVLEPPEVDVPAPVVEPLEVEVPAPVVEPPEVDAPTPVVVPRVVDPIAAG
jgi:hypothetical protein